MPEESAERINTPRFRRYVIGFAVGGLALGLGLLGAEHENGGPDALSLVGDIVLPLSTAAVGAMSGVIIEAATRNSENY